MTASRIAPVIAAPTIVVLLVLGLLPFTTTARGTHGQLRAHCRGALIEAWPESGVSGPFAHNLMPHSLASGSFRAIVCGTEARNRIVVPLMAVAIGAGV